MKIPPSIFVLMLTHHFLAIQARHTENIPNFDEPNIDLNLNGTNDNAPTPMFERDDFLSFLRNEWCEDVLNVMKVMFCQPAKYSCLNRCGETFNPGIEHRLLCSCDSLCVVYGDCCPRFQTECPKQAEEYHSSFSYLKNATSVCMGGQAVIFDPGNNVSDYKYSKRNDLRKPFIASTSDKSISASIEAFRSYSQMTSDGKGLTTWRKSIFIKKIVAFEKLENFANTGEIHDLDVDNENDNESVLVEHIAPGPNPRGRYCNETWYKTLCEPNRISNKCLNPGSFIFKYHSKGVMPSFCIFNGDDETENNHRKSFTSCSIKPFRRPKFVESSVRNVSFVNLEIVDTPQTVSIRVAVPQSSSVERLECRQDIDSSSPYCKIFVVCQPGFIPASETCQQPDYISIQVVGLGPINSIHLLLLARIFNWLILGHIAFSPPHDWVSENVVHTYPDNTTSLTNYLPVNGHHYAFAYNGSRLPVTYTVIDAMTEVLTPEVRSITVCLLLSPSDERDLGSAVCDRIRIINYLDRDFSIQHLETRPWIDTVKLHSNYSNNYRNIRHSDGNANKPSDINGSELGKGCAYKLFVVIALCVLISCFG